MCSRKILLIILVAFMVSFGGNVSADVVESQGLNQYGWQQVWGGTVPNFERLTGSSDREFYDHGSPKKIQIFARHEDYWSQDCGWWYVANAAVDSISISDNATQQVFTDGSLTTTKGTAYINYTWGGNASGSSEKPGRWTVVVQDSSANLTATFYIYVRGQLNVASVTDDGTLTAGGSETITATITDHTGNSVNSSTFSTYDNPLPDVTMYVSGANFYDKVTMSAGASTWTGAFTPPVPGSYKITIEAGDGHDKWLTGRGSMTGAVGGPFPASFYGPAVNILALLVLSFLLSMRINSKIKGEK